MNTNVLDDSNEIENTDNLSMGNIIALENTIATQLSPLLTNSSNQKRSMLARRQKSRINLESKFEEKKGDSQKLRTQINAVSKKENISQQSKVKKHNDIDKQHKKKERYDSLSISDTFKSAKAIDSKHYRSGELRRETVKASHSKELVKSEHTNINNSNNRHSKQRELTTAKETLININIKGYQDKQENRKSALREVQCKSEETKHLQIILSPNQLKSKNMRRASQMRRTEKRNDDFAINQKINDIPEKLIDDNSLFDQNDLSDSILDTAVGDISRNLFIVKHKSKVNNVIPNTVSKLKDDLVLSTQETDFYFANFTPNIAANNKVQTTENAVDSIEDNSEALNVTFNKFMPLESETSDCNTIQEQSNGNLLLKSSDQLFLGCSDKEKLEVTESSRYIKKMLAKLEEDLHNTRKYRFVRRRHFKNEANEIISFNNGVTKLENATLCKKSKSMDLVSDSSMDRSKNNIKDIIIHKLPQAPTCLSPSKNIQIEIKNNNIINIHINSSFDDDLKKNKVENEDKERKSNDCLGDKIGETILEDKFHLHQQKLEKTVKETYEKVKFNSVLNDDVKHNRKKHREEIDMTLAPANKRNKYDYKPLSPKHNLKKCSPRKYKPIINVFNVTAPTSIITSDKYREEQRSFPIPKVMEEQSKPRSFVSLFMNASGKGITISENDLKAVGNKFKNDTDFVSNPQIAIGKLRKHSPIKSLSNNSVPVISKITKETRLNIPKSSFSISTQYNHLNNQTNQNNRCESVGTASYSTLEQTINSKISEYPKPLVSNKVTQSNNINEIFNELYKKDIRQILNPEIPQSSSSYQSLNENLGRCSESSTVKKEHEIIEDAIKKVNNAIEMIEKKEINYELKQKKFLGVRRRKLINTSKTDIEEIREKLEESHNIPLQLSTPKCTKNISHFDISTPVNENRNTHFIGDYITPIKKIAINREPLIGDSITIDNGSNYILINDKQTNVPLTKNDYLKEINRLKRQLEIVEERKQVFEIQEHLIENGNQEHRKHRVGYLMGLKTNSKKVTLKELEHLLRKQDVATFITKIAASNAVNVQFNLANDELNDSVVRTIDGAIVIPDITNKVGYQEIERAFKAMPGVEPSLIPKFWLSNHYKWIVWKLASYERKLSSAESVLTIENVIQQLKFRYDKELYENKHPTLRRIFERNDISEKRMVLCVSDIFLLSEYEYELEVTDGWYSVRAKIDKPLTNQILRGNICVGTKLTIQCAKLINEIACFPLEASEDVRLEINYNNTRKAAWHAKLGYQKVLHYRPILLNTIHPYGGIVSCLKLYIARVYPIKFLELRKDRKVWRNETAENLVSESHQIDLETEADRFTAKLHDMKTHNSSRNHLNADIEDIVNIDCPERLHALIEESKDPDKLMSKLTVDQIEIVTRYKEKLQETYQNKLIDEMMKFKEAKKRDIIAVLKLLVYDVDGEHSYGSKGVSIYLWCPKEWHLQVLKEEKSVLAYNLIPQINYDLKSTSKSYFDSIISKPLLALRRKLLSITELLDDCQVSGCNEFDTFGIFVKKYKENNYQQIWLTDLTGKLLCVHVEYAEEECLFSNLSNGNIVVFGNLRYRKAKNEFAQAIADHYTTTSSSIVTYHQESLETFRKQMPENITTHINSSLDKIESLKKTQDIFKDSFCESTNNSRYNCSTSSLRKSEYETLLPSQMTEEDIAMGQINI